MLKAQEKLSPYIKKVSYICLVILMALPSVVSGQESYRFERMWPTLPQPWYFNEPQGVAVAPDGSVYVADSGFSRIQKFNSDGHFITMWGREGTENGEFGGWGTWQALPPGPKGIVVGSDGTVYVADTYNHRIQIFTPDGVYLDQWGEEGEGEGQFRFPSSITVDTSGNSYVTDYENHRVQKFDSNGDFDIEWGGYGNNNEEFIFPSGIALDSGGNVYVVDETERIQKFSQDGTFIQTLRISSTEYRIPRDIAIDNNGNIYVAINYPSRILKISSNGQLIGSWGSGGTGDDELAHPSGVALDNNGYLYVADRVNNRIKKLTQNGDLVNIWANYDAGDNLFLYPEGITVDNNGKVFVTDYIGNCIHSFTGEDDYECLGEEGNGSELYVLRWRGIAIDDVGNLYVCDKLNNRIQKFSPVGQLITMWGSGDDLPLQPEGIALDSNGNVYVTDHAFEVDPVMYHILRNRVQKFSPNADGTAYTFERLWETWGEEDETFYSPSGIGVGIDQDQGPDPGGSRTEYVYVADRQNHYVHKFNLDGQYITTWTGPEENDTFYYPWGIATDENGNVYVADRGNYRVLKFTSEGSLITSFGGIGSGPGQMGEFHFIAVDSDEKVYLADKYNNRIQVFTKTEGIGNNKAVIVAGGGPYPGNHLWDATQMTANFAYRTLRHQGFGTEDIYYLSSDTDLDLDNDGVSNVFDAPNNQRLNDAIHLAVGDNVDNLVLYLTDHGGIDEDGTGIFRMNQSETLTSTDLATMLDDVQTSIANRSSVIIDACQSGSFINDALLGDNRIIITSSASDEQAKFLNQGTISFSHFFWSNIFNGASIDSAFFNASRAVNFAISDQTPLKAGDTQDVYIGNATAGMLGEVPIIEGELVSSPQELTIETSAVIAIDGVVDPNDDSITRVWAVIWPPDYDTGTIDDPLLNLPTIDLYPVGDNSYEGSYTEFHAVGTYQIAVYAMDEHGNTSLPRFSIVPKNVSRRAIIVAGPAAPDITWQMIEHNAGLAYNTLISQHYGSGDIYFMSPTTFLEDVITYLPEIANFEDQLFTLASDEDIVTLDLTIYLIGGSEDGNFILNDDPNEYETLSASQLDEWLDDLQTLKSGRITVICDFNQSGSFIRRHTLPEGNQRITITSTGEETAAYFNTAGNISFSSFLWDQLAAGATIGDAFIYAREAIAYCSRTNDVSFSCYRPQSPLIDANSNGTPNETIDYGMVEKIKIGDGIVTANDPPQIGSVSAVREGEMITITAEDISSTSPVSRVWAIINPLLYCPGSSEGSPQVTAEVDLEGPDADGKYTYTYPADYACKITVYAMSGTEEEPNISLPKEIRIYQEGGDIYEPDNYPSDANVIVVNYPTAQPHTFHGRDDEDWVKFYGLENDEADSIEDVYTVEASNLGENCPVIELYDADNLTVPIAVASNPPVDGKVWIDYRFQRNGIYYLRLVWGGCDWVEGKMHYDLKVFDGNQGLTAIVRGKVRDRISGAPINGAVIRSSGVGATISTHGEYLLSEIPGSWTLRARKSDYTTATAPIRIDSSDQQIRKDIRMAPRIKRCSEDADCVDGDYCNGIEFCLDEICQPGTNPCQDDGLYCNGEEVGCDEENDICDHSGSPCPGHQACVEEGDECIDKECASEEDCDDGQFCNGEEICVGGFCQAGIYPCAEPTPECDEKQDICVEGPSIQLFPNPHLQLRWMPLLMFLRIVGTNTHFDGTSEVTFDPQDVVMALTILGDSTHLFLIGLIMPSWLSPVESVDVTVNTPTGGEIASETLTLKFLL